MFGRRRFLKTALASSALLGAPLRAKPARVPLRAHGKTRLLHIAAASGGSVAVEPGTEQGVNIVRLRPDKAGRIGATEELAVTVGALPQLSEGVQIWRYKPWNAWTKPMHFASPSDLQSDDVQLLYWRDRDGIFGAAVPLSSAGFRTTLGQIDGRLAARAAALAPAPAPADLPIMAVGHGRDPYRVIAATYRAALSAMGRQESSAEGKTLPEELRYLGWNSWNASNLGRDLDEDLLFSAARTLRKAGVPFGWMTVDDGYFQHREQRLLSFDPDRQKFPNGFAPAIRRLKSEFGVRFVGVWLALNGYWHGIAPEGEVGRAWAADLFNWTERQDRTRLDSPLRSDTFVRPDRPSMRRYYDEHLGRRRADGFDFVKVDNQLAVERMAAGNFPVWQLASAMHEGLNAAAANHFDNSIINCMDLTADAYFNFGRTPVARAVEDYFPYEEGEGYDYERGNAAAHVGQAIYNNLYVSQLAIPDLDMFESTNPNALMHAVARVSNNGPIYITDKPGSHDIGLIRAMAMADGRLLHADAPLRPCEDCLFLLQKPAAMKAFSRVGGAGLLAAFNLADADRVTGRITSADVPGFARAVAYEHVSGRLEHLGPGRPIALDLRRFAAQLWTLHEPVDGFAAFGRSDKLNGAAAVERTASAAGAVEVALREMGPFVAYAANRPSAVEVGGQAVSFTWADGLLRVAAPETGRPGTLRILGGSAKS